MKKPVDQKGGAFIEFALVLPMMVLLTMGIVEFGFVFYNQQVITNASREGARAGIIAQVPKVSDPEIVGIVNNYIDNNLVTFGEGIEPVVEVLRTNTDLTVKVSYQYDFLMLPDFTSALFSDPDGGSGSIPSILTLTSKTVMRYEIPEEEV